MCSFSDQLLLNSSLGREQQKEGVHSDHEAVQAAQKTTLPAEVSCATWWHMPGMGGVDRSNGYPVPYLFRNLYGERIIIQLHSSKDIPLARAWLLRGYRAGGVMS